MKLFKKNYFLLIGIIFFQVAFGQSKEDVTVAKSLFKDVSRESQPYSQSQAYMSLKNSQEKIVQYVTDLAKNKKIIDEALKRERELKSTHYVFYTAIPVFHLLQDITRKIYKRAIEKTTFLDQKLFQFIRYDYNNSIYDQYKNVTNFLLDEIKKNGIVNDRTLGTILVSTNLALFANAGFTGESTWYFFNQIQPWVQEQSFLDFKKKLLESSLKSYGYSITYVDQLLALEKYLQDTHGNLVSDLFQIFVPKYMVDDLGYVSWRLGIPFDTDFIKKLFGRDHMTFGIADKIPYKPDEKNGPTKGVQYLEPTVLSFTEKWKAKDSSVISMVNSLLNNVKAGKFRLSPFLQDYTNNPQKIKNINYVQARLLVNNDMLLNPKSGIIIYRYYSLNPTQDEKYKVALKAIIDQMEAERQKTIQPQDVSGLKDMIDELMQRLETLNNDLRSLQHA